MRILTVRKRKVEILPIVTQLIGVSVRTLHKWEQHTSSSSGAARTLLKIAATNPHSVREALRSA
jgi:DNA-binding transcriptional regulator YiaG